MSICSQTVRIPSPVAGLVAAVVAEQAPSAGALAGDWEYAVLGKVYAATNYRVSFPEWDTAIVEFYTLTSTLEEEYRNGARLRCVDGVWWVVR